MNEIAVNYIGWIGMAFCTIAYVLLNAKVIRYNSMIYQVMNMLGGLGLMLSAYFAHDTPNVAVNILWTLIAFFGVLRFSGKTIQARE